MVDDQMVDHCCFDSPFRRQECEEFQQLTTIAFLIQQLCDKRDKSCKE